jgi:hypothetical protein
MHSIFESPFTLRVLDDAWPQISKYRHRSKVAAQTENNKLGKIKNSISSNGIMGKCTVSILW